jgi:Kef-type K+ transport system membrane component KefB
MIDAVSQLGILMLLLLTGMETDLRLVKQAGRAAISTSAAGIVVPLRLRARARRAVARRNAAETRSADHHLTVSRYSVVDRSVEIVAKIIRRRCKTAHFFGDAQAV